MLPCFHCQVIGSFDVSLPPQSGTDFQLVFNFSANAFDGFLNVAPGISLADTTLTIDTNGVAAEVVLQPNPFFKSFLYLFYIFYFFKLWHRSGIDMCGLLIKDKVTLLNESMGKRAAVLSCRLKFPSASKRANLRV